jgi:hypothetical protein
LEDATHPLHLLHPLVAVPTVSELHRSVLIERWLLRLLFPAVAVAVVVVVIGMGQP